MKYERKVEMYTLYFNKQETIIEVKRAKKGLQDLTFTEDVVRYNDCYYICAQRKPLVEKAKHIKQLWINDLEHSLNKIKQIKI